MHTTLAKQITNRMTEAAFHTPGTLDEASELLAELDNAKLVAGGQWLVPRIRSQEIMPEHIVSTHQISELRGIRERSGYLVMGAAETHDRIANSAPLNAELPGLSSLAKRVGDQQVRNRGTIGGALASDPGRTDYSLALLGLDGTVSTNKRHIKAAELLTETPGAQLDVDEIITAVKLEIPLFCCHKKIPHPAANYAEAGLFLSEFADGRTRMVVSGTSLWPVRLLDAETAMTEKNFEDVFGVIECHFKRDRFFASRLCALLEECLDELP